MRIGTKDFDFMNHCYIMGILNMTPDSFSDGGYYNNLDKAMAHAAQMIEEGASIIDVGGESTRPGYTQITDLEEIGRIVPVIKALKQQFDIPVSVDTYKSQVALAAIEAGADLINDIWGLQYDENMGRIIAESGLPCCLMHNRRAEKAGDIAQIMVEDLKKVLTDGETAGISKERIILDPGVGFAKSYEQNLDAIWKLDALKVLECPILLGTSRKSVVGLTLDLPKDQRVEGTIATTVTGVMRGASIIRVHDVKENYRAMKMTEAMMKK